MSSLISSVCSAYDAGQVTGPLCPDLCEQNIIHPGKCFSTVTEKMVYDGEWGGIQVFLKMNMDWFNHFGEKQEVTDNDILSSFQYYVSSRVESLFGDCSECDKLTSRLMQLGDSNSDGVITATEVRTFVSLLNLIEPMMLITLNDSKHTVDFYGYCGGLYIVEKVPFIASQVFGEKWQLKDLSLFPDALEPLEETARNIAVKIANAAFSIPYISTILSDTVAFIKYLIFTTFFQSHAPSESEKFRFLYSVLDATLDLSSNPYNGMLHSCDMHLGNYGFTNNSVVKVIDFDQTYPVAFLSALLQQIHCSSDDDCWKGTKEDCQSSCDTATGACTSAIQRQDLINICVAHIPTVLQHPGQNSTCLKKAVGRLVGFCRTLPVIESIQQLREAIHAVKGRLKYIESSCSQIC